MSFPDGQDEERQSLSDSRKTATAGDYRSGVGQGTPSASEGLSQDFRPWPFSFNHYPRVAPYLV
jgi:hypothetical protein